MGNLKTDPELLHDYLAHGTQDAFAQLVARYIDLVYSSALRQVRDPHQAEDVTQIVLLALGQKAGRLRSRPALGGWLLTATRFASTNALKLASRRKEHERQAAQLISKTQPQEQAMSWTEIAPLLDEAIFPARIVHLDMKPNGAIWRVQEIVLTALDADTRPKEDDFFLDLRKDIQLNQVDDLRSAFRLPADERVGLKDLEALDARCQQKLQQRLQEQNR